MVRKTPALTWVIPAGRYAEPEEISHLVAYLVSDAASFVIGQVIPINGGEVIVGI